MLVPDAPSTPNYINNSTYTVPTRHASSSTHKEDDSDVSRTPKKGLRAILARFSTYSDADESDASPKYSPIAQSESSDSDSDSDSDSESDNMSEKSNQDDDTDSDV